MLGVTLRVNDTYTHKEININVCNAIVLEYCAKKIPFNYYFMAQLMKGISNVKGSTL